MKKLTLALCLGVAFASSGHAQILGSFYNSTVPQTKSPAQDFIDAGVTGITTTTPVSGFDVSTASPTSGPLSLTLVNANPWTTVGSGVYQSGYYTGPTTIEAVTVSGLSSVLEANQTYDLYISAFDLFSGSQDPMYGGSATVGFNYGLETDSGNYVGHNTFEFTLTTGAAVIDSLSLTTFSSGTTNPAQFPTLTAFALVGPTVPEPGTYALLGLGMTLLLVTVRNRRSLGL